MGSVDGEARVKDLDLPRTRNWNAPALDTYARACLLRHDARLGDVISHSRGCLSYLATPYSKLARDDDGAFSSAGSLECAARAARWARLLALEGITAVSPIIQAVEMVHVDVIDPQLDPLDERFWEGWCQPLLNACGGVIVPPIPGWKESEGIWVEVCAALRAQRPVFLIRPGAEFGGVA